MLQPIWITVVTIGGGSVLAAVVYGLTVLRTKRWMVPLDLWTGYLINCLTLVTLGCFIYNVCFAIFSAAMMNHPIDGIRIEGNEALIFWIFVYSFGQGALSIRRALLSA